MLFALVLMVVPARFADAGALNPSLAKGASRGAGVATVADDADANEPVLLPLVVSSADARRTGIARIINHGAGAGEVRIHAIDDAGTRYGPLVLAIAGRATIHLTAADIEAGNAAKNLTGALGRGEGDWRLEFDSTLDIEALAYARAGDGFLAALHDVAPSTGNRHRLAVFESAGDSDAEGLLRLINPGSESARVSIAGIDDAGESPGQFVKLTLGAGAARTLSARLLETGGEDLEGALGDGAGRWRLSVIADRPIRAMSLLETPAGRLTNLSTAPQRAAGPATASDVFRESISAPVVQAKCIACHVQDGQSGGTRLVFTPAASTGHESANYAVFADFLGQVADGDSVVLNKIKGVDHGGGEQVAADSDDYQSMKQFLELLRAEVPPPPAETAADVFRDQISRPVVQARCINCHVATGVSRNTRLVFERSSAADYQAANLQVFATFLADVPDGVNLILAKVQGQRNHGGGAQLPRGTANFANLKRFLELLDAESNDDADDSADDSADPVQRLLVPLFPSTSDGQRYGLLRIINHAAVAGEVTITAADDAGESYGPLTLAIAGKQTVHLDAFDLEFGNADKGLTGATGVCRGSWRLTLESHLDIEALAYARTADGLLTAMHDLAPSAGNRHRLAMFEPDGVWHPGGVLRLVNPGTEPATVVVSGTDDQGAAASGTVELTIPADQARELTARRLETGGTEQEGALGDGAGHWQLRVESDEPILAMGVSPGPWGHLANLSTAPHRGAGPEEPEPEETAADVFGSLVSTQIVQAKCVNCHVQGGASGHTRLVFARAPTADHEATNLQVFRDFLAAVENGGSLILNKVQGFTHGGGVQLTEGTDDFAALKRFIELLEAEAAAANDDG